MTPCVPPIPRVMPLSPSLNVHRRLTRGRRAFHPDRAPHRGRTPELLEEASKASGISRLTRWSQASASSVISTCSTSGCARAAEVKRDLDVVDVGVELSELIDDRPLGTRHASSSYMSLPNTTKMTAPYPSRWSIGEQPVLDSCDSVGMPSPRGALPQHRHPTPPDQTRRVRRRSDERPSPLQCRRADCYWCGQPGL